MTGRVGRSAGEVAGSAGPPPRYDPIVARLVRVGRWIGGALAACSAVALCQSCGGRTSVVVTVATDIADLDFVSIEASGPRGSRPPAPDIEPDAAWVFAREFLATDEMDGETFAFTARGYRDDLVVALQTRSVRIARDQVQTLALHLCDDCGGQDCQGQACLDAGGACTLRGDPAVATWSSEAPAPTCSPSGCEEDEACENAGVSDCGEFVPDAVKGGVCTLPAPACAEGDVAVPGGCLDLSVCISDDEWRARDDALPNRVWVRKGHGGKNYEPNGSYEKPYRNVADAMKDKPNATLFLMRRPADDANGKTYAVSLVTNGIELRGKCPGDVRLEGSVTIGPGVTGATLRSLTLDALDVDSGAAVTVDAGPARRRRERRRDHLTGGARDHHRQPRGRIDRRRGRALARSPEHAGRGDGRGVRDRRRAAGAGHRSRGARRWPPRGRCHPGGGGQLAPGARR